jgi:hypothetical protein
LGKRYGIGLMLLETYWELGEQIRNIINNHWEWQTIWKKEQPKSELI